ncbi:hypothetical protein SDC9_32123 [bioreactor metagenome]|uniref:VWFA domain-containing protein n=1 Tax=bioreactor metagenome TaxID=1076179 RepID=A0A644V4L6_9ZZZZ|nr:VWA domain-containing protein [Methanobrevibacter sp.]MEA4958063.1 VWA domain-containing protein [Methanobrevibacter sp.]
MIEGVKREKLYGKRINSQSKKGKYVKSKISNKFGDIAIDATLRAALLKNKNNSQKLKKNNKNIKTSPLKVDIKKEDLREKIRKHGAKLSVVLVVDMSGSMIGEEKLNRIKLILQKIISNIQANKDKLSVIGFKGKDSEVIIPNTTNPNSFLEKLNNITVGGTTPMAAGLVKGLEVLKKDFNKEEYIPMMMILSDGITNVSLDRSNNQRLNNNKNLKNKLNLNNKEIISNPINDVLKIGEEIAKYNIHTVIVNFEKEKSKGRSVNKELAFITSGNFYDLEALGNILTNDIFEGEDVDINSMSFGSFKSDLSDMVLEKIIDYERENL